MLELRPLRSKHCSVDDIVNQISEERLAVSAEVVLPNWFCK